MPGTDQAGYAGFRDEVNNHYAADLRHRGADESDQRRPGGGTDGGVRRRYVRATGLLPAESVGDGGADGRLIGELTVGFGGPARDRAGDEHRANLEIRPGYEFNVMVTEDLAFPGPYKG